MVSILKLLQEVSKRYCPEITSSVLYKVLEISIILSLVYTAFSSVSDSLRKAKSDRDEQIKGYAVQIGYNRSEVEKVETELRDEIKRMREWNKALSERVFRLETLSMKK